MEKIEIVGYSTVLVICAILTIASTGLLIPNNENTLTGTNQPINIEVYQNQETTQNCTQIRFGIVKPGEPTNQTVHIKNAGTNAVSLSINASDWDPVESGSWLALTWNRAEHILKPNESINATLTLNVNKDAAGFSDFYFNITITGIQVDQRN